MTRRAIIVFERRAWRRRWRRLRLVLSERARQLQTGAARLGCALRGHGALVGDHHHGRPVVRCLRCFATWPRNGPLHVGPWV